MSNMLSRLQRRPSLVGQEKPSRSVPKFYLQRLIDLLKEQKAEHGFMRARMVVSLPRPLGSCEAFLWLNVLPWSPRLNSMPASSCGPPAGARSSITCRTVSLSRSCLGMLPSRYVSSMPSRRCWLENDPAILLEDADLSDDTMRRMAHGVFAATGQVCMAIKR